MTRLPWWGWLLITLGAWTAAAVAVAVVLALTIRRRDEPPVPQLDWPLWRGTDLDRPSRPIHPDTVAGGQTPPPQEPSP